MSSKKIFIKKKENVKQSIYNDDIKSDELSDELNNLIGTNNNMISSISNNIKQEFDIINIYQDIYNCLNKYKECNITGEIISFKISDDNAWINIKCKDYQINGIFWKISKNKKYIEYKNLKSGDQIIFIGNFSIMKKNLNIYFNIKNMEKVGKGDYLDLFENYKLKIKEIGLGYPKKKINIYPYNIGIITALEGAAIQDILQTFKLDNFKGNVIIKNTLVQGIQCPKSIINSLEWFEINYLNKIDILMLTRGGGSHEDLVGFSEWNVLVKFASVPFIKISAVGHQIDNQLTDEIADYKFATPSIGAKFIIEKQNEYKLKLNNIKKIIDNIKLQYSIAIDKLNYINKNYDNIIKKYNIQEILIKTSQYSNVIKNILNNYNLAKVNFFNNISNFKPSIYRNDTNELLSINDFININKNKTINPKKIEIKFIDGKINISYKIIDYEQY